MPAAVRFNSDETPDSSAVRFEIADALASDTVDLTFITREIHVGTGGIMHVIREDGVEVILPLMPDGHVFPIRARRIKATGLAASNIVVLY